MIKFGAILLCLCYNLVSLGATLQIHSCGNKVLWSISETEDPHETCPLCSTEPTKSCHGDACQDLELKLDQLSDQLFANNNDSIQVVDTAIITLPWIMPFKKWVFTQRVDKAQILTYSNSSPPIYILNCTYRI